MLASIIGTAILRVLALNYSDMVGRTSVPFS